MTIESTNMEIKELRKLLSNTISPVEDIENVRITRLSAIAENYGSIMLRVDIDVKNRENGKSHTVHGVAKIIPMFKEVQAIFNTQVTYKNEVAFYDIILPTLKQFSNEHKLSQPLLDVCFCKFLGARINLNGSDIVDEDAVLMLENLKLAGYINGDRTLGLDFDVTKLILKNLAFFHAVPLALKLKRPQVFQEKILPYCSHFETDLERTKLYDNIVKRILNEHKDCRALIPKIRPWGEKEKQRQPREPFSTLVHNDLWVNNTMQKFVNGKVISNKFVDFQVIYHGSPASDVFFFLFSSVQLEVLKQNMDFLLRYYHEHFTQILQEFQCDLEPFNYAEFSKEMATEGSYEFSHAIVFSTILVPAKRDTADFDGKPPNEEQVYQGISQEKRERAQYMAMECEKRGWL